MAWIRLDDQIASHPKLLKAGFSAAWLWVCCISYSQRHLTDGFVTTEALTTFGSPDVDSLIGRLIETGLLEHRTHGVQVHDYLDFNESSKTIKTRREHDRVRKMSERNPTGVRPESKPSRARVRSVAVTVASPSPKEERNNKLVRNASVSTTSGNGNGNGSKRPIYQSDRFVVFEWQLDGLRRLLGPDLLEAFDLHGFFDNLTQDSRHKNLVIPQRDGGEWLQAQVLAEAKRRGLAVASAAPHNKRIASLVTGGENFLKQEKRRG